MNPAYYAIVLAAGGATRFGGSKLTARLGDSRVLDETLRIATTAPVVGVTVVTGAHRDAVTDAVDAVVATSAGPLITLATCPDHADGLSRSLRCGLASLPPNAAGAFIFLGDMPHVPHDVAAKLLAALRPGLLAAVPTHDGCRGHPVLITAALFARFAMLEGDNGGGALLATLGPALARVEVEDPGILADIDTPADLAALN